MAELNEIYRRAQYYDVAFDREIGGEVQFIFGLHRRRTGRPLEPVLEIACGPGYHACAFAKRGVRTFGQDLRPEMIEYARDIAARFRRVGEYLIPDGFCLVEPTR